MFKPRRSSLLGFVCLPNFVSLGDFKYFHQLSHAVVFCHSTKGCIRAVLVGEVGEGYELGGVCCWEKQVTLGHLYLMHMVVSYIYHEVGALRTSSCGLPLHEKLKTF